MSARLQTFLQSFNPDGSRGVPVIAAAGRYLGRVVMQPFFFFNNGDGGSAKSEGRKKIILTGIPEMSERVLLMDCPCESYL